MVKYFKHKNRLAIAGERGLREWKEENEGKKEGRKNKWKEK